MAKENEQKLDDQEVVSEETEATNETENVQEEVEVEVEVKEETNSEAEALEYKNKFLRLSADFQNFKRRSEKEKTDIFKFANEKLMLDLLPILDNMERAIEHAGDDSDETSILDGLKLIQKSFSEMLTKNGVEPIKAVGEEFDPALHHAVMSAESDDHESHVVIEEFQKGYKLKDKVIRHSMVKVSS